MFKIGPNTLTFILPAEIFPTRYRCTCHGIAAASGKLGSVVVQLFLPYVKFSDVRVSEPNSNGLGWVLIIFSILMALGGCFAWAWIPEVQYSKRQAGWALPNKTLEDLAVGRRGGQAEGDNVGFRPWMNRVRQRLWPGR